MARQTFEEGQYVMWRQSSRQSRWDKREGREPRWWLGIAAKVVEGNKRVYVRHNYDRPDQIRSIHSLQFQDVRNQSDTIRPASFSEVDAAMWEAMWRATAVESERKMAGEQRTREEAEQLERGWAFLLDRLDGAMPEQMRRAILEPLIDEHALRSYGAKEAVQA